MDAVGKKEEGRFQYPLSTSFVSAAVDRPAGRADSVPSNATGKLLQYFTPNALADLLDRARSTPGRSKTQSGFGQFDSLAFARAASRRGTSGEVDLKQAFRLCEVVTASRRLWSVEDLQELASGITTRSAAIRQEIVFSGGPTASHADHIYAPYGVLPELMHSLAGALALRFEDVHPAHRAALIGFFCIHMHPFRDGNGRWSRLVTAGAVQTADDAMPGMVSAAFQADCKRELGEKIWPSSRAHGLRHYLALAAEFEARVHGANHLAGAYNAVRDVNQEIGRIASNRTGSIAAMKGLWSLSYLEMGELRSKLNVSARSAAGLAERLSCLHGTLVAHKDDRLSVEGVLNQIDASINFAKRQLFNGVTG